MTDFGADHAFAQVPKKLREHYGIEIPESTVRKTTLRHAAKMHTQQENVEKLLKAKGCAVMVAEVDGCMLPIVTIGEAEGDKRKQKKLHWKEARLALAHELGNATPQFAATFGVSADEAGQSLLNCAVAAGFGTQTQLHSVGDGATWIADQVDNKFGTQGSFLVDFYHVCDYLAAAAKVCATNDSKVWIETQKKLLKNNDYKLVIKNLNPHLEGDDIEESNAPVRACHRYLSNRTDQLDYKSAIENGLPIGSGEIESAHRYVIQARLKLPGAWWKAANVGTMLTLRTVRANGKWDDYWGNLAEAA
jgi:Uncharacterised protein family (UPF0236)